MSNEMYRIIRFHRAYSRKDQRDEERKKKLLMILTTAHVSDGTGLSRSLQGLGEGQVPPIVMLLQRLTAETHDRVPLG